MKATDDQEVAELLGMTKAAFSDRKRRDSFPADKVRALAQQRPDLGIDMEHVLTGVSTPTTNTLGVLRECTEQVMLLGLPSTASIAVRDIVFGTRTGNAQMVQDGIALLYTGMSNEPAAAAPKRVVKATAPIAGQHATSASANVGGSVGGDVLTGKAIKAGGDVIAPGVISSMASKSIFAMPIGQMNIRKKE